MKKLIISILFVSLISLGYSNSLYRPAVKAGNFLYISGQNAQSNNESLKNEDITQQTKKAILLIEKTLKAHDYTLNDIVDVNVAIAKQKDFKDFNKEYKKYFTNKPARSTSLGVLHQNIGALVEISAIAYKK
ncbi:hypothetical protein fh0823_14390 [Francisella halioticida]|uniref:Reactive intermediate/imine deaminase n=1 Tax=Francisella halioticida TaxID=549298 RepID=A0ABN5AX21_9GAMM|nr:RidA family protein [Francisella halioticida]ASG68426.1 hypothetical protein CDV26_08495 [Francisella halioticida]BCD91300.1 hypothetical protein fh0823_14390 [Francisella halioticida]